MKAIYRALALALVTYGLARGQSVSGGGGSGNVADGGTNGGVYRDPSGTLHATATGGAGTLCLTSANGGTPVFASCSGSASTLWSALSNPTGNMAINVGTFTSQWTIQGNTSTANLFSIIDTTGNTGTGSLFEVHSVGTSVAKPFTFTAQGTANGIQMSSAGAVAKIGTGSIAADSMAVGGLTGLGTGIGTWLVTPSGANLATALTTSLPNTKGGTGGDSSAQTGVAHVSSGTWSYSAVVNADVTSIDAATKLTGITPGANGGTANGFFAVSGPATSLKTFTFPNASATVLTTNAAVTAGQGGTGVANTATLTLGSSNQNWATLATGIVKNTTTTGAISAAVSADVYGLWSGTCSSSTFLRGDGACATPSGSGTVTVSGGGSVTSTAFVTGAGTTVIQTPSATSTLDSSGNAVFAGTVAATSFSSGTSPPSSSVCTAGTAGGLCLGEGTIPTGTLLAVGVLWENSSNHRMELINNNSTSSAVPTLISSDAFTNKTYNGLTVTTTTATLTLAGNLITTGAFNATFALGASATFTMPTTSQTIPGMNQANTAGSSLTWDLSAASTTAGLKIPSAAGAVPTADGFEATNTTNHTHVWGSNGTTMVGAIAATGTGTATTCTNQFVSVVSSLAVPTCATVAAAAMVNAGVFTGDVTTTFPAVTVAKVNGIAYSATAAAHSVEVITTANTTATAKAIPDCTDSAGSHLNFTQSTDNFSCGTSSSGGGAAGATLFSTTNSTTVTATSATTLIGTVSGSTTVAANTFTAGQLLQIHAHGYYSTPATPASLTIDLKIGGTIRITTGAVVQIASVTNGVWNMDCDVTTRTAGASGTQIANCIFVGTGSTLTAGEAPLFTSSTWTIDTTATEALDVQATWSTATGSPTLTSTNIAAWIPGAPVTSVFGLTGAVGNLTGDVTTSGVAATIANSVVTSAKLNITTTTCTAPTVLTAISATGTGTCTAPLLTPNDKSAAYTTVLGDAGKMIVHLAADTTARVFTIDSNANVAYTRGTCISFVNETSAGTLTIAITSDTLVLQGAGTTGSRTLTASNWATACKIETTTWAISGSSGLT